MKNVIFSLFFLVVGMNSFGTEVTDMYLHCGNVHGPFIEPGFYFTSLISDNIPKLTEVGVGKNLSLSRKQAKIQDATVDVIQMVLLENNDDGQFINHTYALKAHVETKTTRLGIVSMGGPIHKIEAWTICEGTAMRK